MLFCFLFFGFCVAIVAEEIAMVDEIDTLLPNKVPQEPWFVASTALVCGFDRLILGA
jgi:hypothetical protein